MTPEEHRAEHKEMHNVLCRLYWDCVYHKGVNSDYKYKGSIDDFMLWSYGQTINPTEIREEASDGD